MKISNPEACLGTVFTRQARWTCIQPMVAMAFLLLGGSLLGGCSMKGGSESGAIQVTFPRADGAVAALHYSDTPTWPWGKNLVASGPAAGVPTGFQGVIAPEGFHSDADADYLSTGTVRMLSNPISNYDFMLPPFSLNDFSCFAVMVTGSEIPSDPRVRNCSLNSAPLKVGMLAGSVPRSAGSLELMVPQGPSRTFWVLAFRSKDGSCPGIDVMAAEHQDEQRWENPYVVATSTIDVRGDAVLTMTASYLPLNAQRIQCEDTPERPIQFAQIAAGPASTPVVVGSSQEADPRLWVFQPTPAATPLAPLAIASRPMQLPIKTLKSSFLQDSVVTNDNSQTQVYTSGAISGSSVGEQVVIVSQQNSWSPQAAIPYPVPTPSGQAPLSLPVSPRAFSANQSSIHFVAQEVGAQGPGQIEYLYRWWRGSPSLDRVSINLTGQTQGIYRSDQHPPIERLRSLYGAGSNCEVAQLKDSTMLFGGTSQDSPSTAEELNQSVNLSNNLALSAVAKVADFVSLPGLSASVLAIQDPNGEDRIVVLSCQSGASLVVENFVPISGIKGGLKSIAQDQYNNDHSSFPAPVVDVRISRPGIQFNSAGYVAISVDVTLSGVPASPYLMVMYRGTVASLGSYLFVSRSAFLAAAGAAHSPSFPQWTMDNQISPNLYMVGQINSGASAGLPHLFKVSTGANPTATDLTAGYTREARFPVPGGGLHFLIFGSSPFLLYDSINYQKYGRAPHLFGL